MERLYWMLFKKSPIECWMYISSCRSEIDLSETELPDKDLKLLEILVKRWGQRNIFTDHIFNPSFQLAKLVISMSENFLKQFLSGDRKTFMRNKRPSSRIKDGRKRRKGWKRWNSFKRRREEKWLPKRGRKKGRISFEDWRSREKSLLRLKITWNNLKRKFLSIMKSMKRLYSAFLKHTDIRFLKYML